MFAEKRCRCYGLNYLLVQMRVANKCFLAFADFHFLAFINIIMPVAYEFAPELVLVSAGFDAARGDPLGGYRVSPEMYGHMTHQLTALADLLLRLLLTGRACRQQPLIYRHQSSLILLPDLLLSLPMTPPICLWVGRLVGLLVSWSVTIS